MATREVSHGGMIARIAASAAKRRIAPPTGPLSAPPKEIGESFAGEFGVDGSVGFFGGTVVGRGAELVPGATGTAEAGTMVTPFAGVNGWSSGGGTVTGFRCGREKNGFRSGITGVVRCFRCTTV
jgi:hypothetical protein